VVTNFSQDGEITQRKNQRLGKSGKISGFEPGGAIQREREEVVKIGMGPCAGLEKTRIRLSLNGRGGQEGKGRASFECRCELAHCEGTLRDCGLWIGRGR